MTSDCRHTNGLSLDLFDAHLRFGDQAVFSGLHLSLPASSWTCVLGPSGVGKSTLLAFIAGLSPPHATGRVRIPNPPERPIAYMAQNDLLLPWLSVLDNVLLGSRLRAQVPDRDRALALLDRVGLGSAAGKRPADLSGGMRQRAALIRTLMEECPIVLMDEPFSALDPLTRLKLQDLAAELLEGRTVLLVTHDPLEALRLGDRLLVMTGSPARLHDPIIPASARPRDVRDPDILAHQAELLDLLAREAREAAP